MKVVIADLLATRLLTLDVSGRRPVLVRGDLGKAVQQLKRHDGTGPHGPAARPGRPASTCAASSKRGDGPGSRDSRKVMH
jgi:hypothetical protein